MKKIRKKLTETSFTTVKDAPMLISILKVEYDGVFEVKDTIEENGFIEFISTQGRGFTTVIQIDTSRDTFEVTVYREYGVFDISSFRGRIRDIKKVSCWRRNIHFEMVNNNEFHVTVY